MITVAQAIHWFDLDAFFSEIKRVLKPGGLLAVWGYGLLRIDSRVDSLVDHFYKNIIGSYWDVERRLIDEAYATIPFPFEELNIDRIFSIQLEWNRIQFEGYLNTWSSVQKYFLKNKINAVDDLMVEICSVWKEDEVKQVTFPLFLRCGRSDVL